MDNRIFAPAATAIGNEVTLDLNGFISRLLLFDHYTLDSMLMRELAQMIGVFGIEGLQDLLSSGIISIHSSALTYGQIETKFENEQYGRPMRANHTDPMPYNHFDIVHIDINNRREYIGHGFRQINNLGYRGRETSGLKSEILDHLTELPNVLPAFQMMQESLSLNGDVAKNAIGNALLERGYSTPVNFENELEFNFSLLQDNVISAETNIKRIMEINEYEEHKIIERAILSVCGFYQRLGLMKAYDSITWFSDQDSKLFEAEMKRISTDIRSNAQEARMSRVIELSGLPAISQDSMVDVHRLMRMRDSRECIEFREWLKTNDAKSDEDIRREIGSFSAAFANSFTTTRSRVARFALSTVIGASNPPLGLALGAMDQFIVDKVLKRNGPIWFLNNEMPKLGKPY